MWAAFLALCSRAFLGYFIELKQSLMAGSESWKSSVVSALSTALKDLELMSIGI